MKVLVTGSSGLPGRDVLRQLDGRGISCRGADAPEFKVTDSEAVYRLVDEYAPDVIVHCAAYTNVDKAASEPATCAAVNGSGALTMSRAALRVGARLLLLSTAQVFSGEGDRPNPVSASHGPKNVYAIKDPVRSVLRAAQDRRSLTLSCDRIIQPTWSKDLARVICDVIATESFGIWHARNSRGACTPAEFAEMVMKKSGVSCQIIPVHDAELPSHVRRPLNGRLAAKLPDGITPMPDLSDALDRYLQEINR